MNKFITVPEGTNTYTTEDGLLTVLFMEDKLQVLFNVHGTNRDSVLITECERNGSTDEEYIQHELMYMPRGSKFLFSIGCKKTISGFIGDWEHNKKTVNIIVSSVYENDGIDNIELTYHREDNKTICNTTIFNYIKNMKVFSVVS